MGDSQRWYSLMHAIISLATYHPSAPEQTLQLAGQGGPVQIRRARSRHHHQQHTWDKPVTMNSKELTYPAFDPVARHCMANLARHRKAEPTFPAIFLPGQVANKMTPRHTFAPLEDELVLRGARNARGWWKRMGTRHNRFTAFAALHSQATAALAPP